jgi:hypothetical protein
MLLAATHLIPYFLHKIIMAISPIITIQTMDADIWATVKDILHLLASTPNSLL